MSNTSGRHFLQVPGPSNVPDRVLRAIARPTIDHRGPEFGRLALELLEELKPVFKTTAGKVMIFPSSGTGAWEAAIVNTISPGDKVLMFETGQFATLWKNMAVDLGLDVQFVADDWRHGADPDAVESILREDQGAQDQGRVRGAQRDVERGDQFDSRDAQGAGSRGASGVADGGYDFVAGFDGLPARRMGRGRGDRRFAKGPDAAAGPGVQRGWREGVRCGEVGEDAEVVLGLAGHARPEQERLLPVYAGDESAVWVARIAADAAGGRAWRTCSRGTPGMAKPRGAR